jgi:hypothetical protein
VVAQALPAVQARGCLSRLLEGGLNGRGRSAVAHPRGGLEQGAPERRGIGLPRRELFERVGGGAREPREPPERSGVVGVVGDAGGEGRGSPFVQAPPRPPRLSRGVGVADRARLDDRVDRPIRFVAQRVIPGRDAETAEQTRCLQCLGWTGRTERKGPADGGERSGERSRAVGGTVRLERARRGGRRGPKVIQRLVREAGRDGFGPEIRIGVGVGPARFDQHEDPGVVGVQIIRTGPDEFISRLDRLVRAPEPGQRADAEGQRPGMGGVDRQKGQAGVQRLGLPVRRAEHGEHELQRLRVVRRDLVGELRGRERRHDMPVVGQLDRQAAAGEREQASGSSLTAETYRFRGSRAASSSSAS